jgi:hypothetical protein
LPIQSKSSTARSTSDSDLVNDPLREKRQANIAKLQDRWECKAHGGFCWKNPEGMCHRLTYSNIGFWSVEIVSTDDFLPLVCLIILQCENRATVDKKPDALSLTVAEPRSRMQVTKDPEVAATNGFQQHGCHGQGPACQHHALTAPPPVPVPVPAQISDDSHIVDYPDVISWTRHLDRHPNRNRDGIKFLPYGRKLDEKGFKRINNISRDFFSVEELARWLELGEQIGIASLIMQYAKADTDAIKSGRLVFQVVNNEDE